MSCSLVQNADKPVGVANLPNARKKLVVNEADVLVCRELFKQSSLPIARMALDQCEECQFAVIVLDCVEAARLDLVELFHGVAPYLSVNSELPLDRRNFTLTNKFCQKRFDRSALDLR